MSLEITPDQVAAFYKHMQEHFRTRIVTKEDAAGMQMIDAALDALGVSDKEDFLDSYAMSVGDRICLPFTPGNDDEPLGNWEHILVGAHEHQRVVQYARDGMAQRGPGCLRAPSARARFETEAFLASSEVQRWRWDKPLSHRFIEKKLSTYGCSFEDLQWAQKYLTLGDKSTASGYATTEAGAVAIEWLNEHMPGLFFAAFAA